MSDKDDAPAENTDQRRRELLNIMKNAAIAGPVLLTLKNTPAFAQQGATASCMSANHLSHGEGEGYGPGASNNQSYAEWCAGQGGGNNTPPGGGNTK